MTTCRTAGMIAVMVVLLSITGWSQESNSPVDDQRSLPTLELSDVVVVGVERAGQPQGIRHRELPAVPPAIVLSTVVNIREFSKTAIGIRHVPGMLPITTTHFLTAWIGGANHHSADASAAIHARGNTAQGALHVDWLSRNGVITWQDRHNGILRAAGNLRPSESLSLNIQGRLEQSSWRDLKPQIFSEKRRTQSAEIDALTHWHISRKIQSYTRLSGTTWTGNPGDGSIDNTSDRLDIDLGFKRQGQSTQYQLEVGGTWIQSVDSISTYAVNLVQAKYGFSARLSDRITFGTKIGGAFWRDAQNEDDARLLPEGFINLNLLPLFNFRVQGGNAVSALDVSDRWELNPYLFEPASPWIQTTPAWVLGEINRSLGYGLHAKAWGGWEKIKGYPTFSDYLYDGMFSSDPDTIEITKAGLGFQWQLNDQIGIEMSGERVWGTMIQGSLWDENLMSWTTRSNEVPYLENGSAQAKVIVRPIPNWMLSVWGHLHGRRHNWDESSDLPSYGTVGAEIRWKTPTPFWLALWGENLTDTHYDIFPGYEGEPLRVGIRLGFMTSPY